MNKKQLLYPHTILCILVLFIVACNSAERPPTSVIVTTPEQLDKKATNYIQNSLDYAKEHKGDIGDSVFILNDTLLRMIYEKNDFNTLWSSKEEWKANGDSMLRIIQGARVYGLFPEDYHFLRLDTINKRFVSDSEAKKDRRDAALWAKADLMLTDAFFQMVRDIKLGRLPKDSITLRADSILTSDFYLSKLDTLNQTGLPTQVLESLEPKHKGYRALKEAARKFLDSADYRDITIVPPSGKDIPAYKKALQTRLYETGYIPSDSAAVDSVVLATAIKRFQKKSGLTVDGRAGAGTLRMLNMSDRDKFMRIAITMDKYKMLPEQMPDHYAWVNLPAFYMKLIDDDTVRMTSKIICGKPATRTPVLTSAIGELITYPQWTMPESIVEKEIIPEMKKDTTYLSRKGYTLIDKDGNEVDPQTVEWKKYKKGIPYKVVQGSGDDNALGVLKFNFNNKYAVYLHDTNQRYLFAQAVRSLSHGCVRVQQWQQFAYDIIRYDTPDTTKPSPKRDSLDTWLLQKVKRSIPIRNRLPLFIRYFTCEGNQNGVVFYDDMYGEDKFLREKYFAGK